MANLAANSETHQTQQFFTAMELNEDPRSGTIDDVNPLIFTAKTNDEDTPDWRQATGGENKDGFWEVMWKETMTLTEIDAWEIVPRTE